MVDQLFANGTFKSLENHLLDEKKILELSRLDKKDFINNLILSGIGIKVASFDEVLSEEELNFKSVLRANSPDLFLTDRLFCSSDAYLIKYLYKVKLYEIPLDDNTGKASLNYQELKDAILGGKEVSDKYLQKVIKKTNDSLGEELDVFKLSNLIDKIVLEEAIIDLKKKCKVLYKYYQNQIDYLNILNYYRILSLGLKQIDFEYIFIEGGRLEKDLFINNFGDTSLKEVQKSDLELEKVLKNYLKNDSIIKLELSLKQLLLDHAKEASMEVFDFSPILYYFLAHQAMIYNIRLAYGKSDLSAQDLLKF